MGSRASAWASALTPQLCPLLWGTVPPWCPHAPSLSRRPLLHSSRHRHALPRAPCVKGQGLVTKAGGHSDPRNTHHYLTAAHLQEQEERAEASLWLSLPLPPTQAPPTWMAGGESPHPRLLRVPLPRWVGPTSVPGAGSSLCTESDHACVALLHLASSTAAARGRSPALSFSSSCSLMGMSHQLCPCWN